MGDPDYFRITVTGWRRVALSWAAFSAIYPHMRNAATKAPA
ncbi:hypothetical protein [Novosphingobium clariflavum]|uniref:Uncharacterized protein n=1 Tax=Novosphingobium clariflavum TaxID=2029884 RepID=A0ABV6S1C7_9SPHN|nr:hypothetical protein [Novosphingobium clariflavum]